MGNYNSVFQNLKRQVLLEKLLEKGVLVCQSGLSVYEAGYEEIKYEWVLLSFREIDVENGMDQLF